MATASLDERAEGLVKTLTVFVARFVEAAAALIIAVASLQALGGYLRGLVLGRRGRIGSPDRAADDETAGNEDTRLRLGKSLALALEFLLAADILKTAVAPTWNDIGQLAAIAVLRTALNYFLERELRAAEQREVPRGVRPPGKDPGTLPAS